MIEYTFDIFDFQQSRFPNDRAIVTVGEEGEEALSTGDCIKLIDRLRYALVQLEVMPGHLVAMIPNQARAEWILLDAAIQSLGAITVPIHFSTTVDRQEHILSETGSKLCFYHSREAQLNSKDIEFTEVQFVSVDDLFVKIKNNQQQEKNKYQADKKNISTIIYTSGTTGEPKGVMLSHENIMSNVMAIYPLIPKIKNRRALSFLPYSHAFERTIIYTWLYCGISIYVLEDRNRLQEKIQIIKPHYFSAVPRIMERMYSEILAYQANQSLLGEKITQWAIAQGKKDLGGIHPINWVKRVFLSKVIFKKFTKRLGGKIEGIIVGAAHLNPDLGRLFESAGIPIREGYGMTEASPVIAVNRFEPGLNKFGTVGLPLPGVEVRIKDPDESGSGEVVVRGPNIMKGYYKNEEATETVVDSNGWLYTGDIGTFVEGRFLQITDRKKDIFKTSSGKYVAPQHLEQQYRASLLIDQIMIIGFRRPYVAALIYPDYTVLRTIAEKEKIHWTSAVYMAHNVRIRQFIQRELDQLHAEWPTYQRIRSFFLLYEPFTIEKSQLSDTLKLRRKKILEDFTKEIEGMYSH